MKKHTIFYIDDEPLNLRLVEKMMRNTHFHFHGIVDAREGIRKAREVIPDVIIMDIDMPEMDGLQATQIIKADDKLHRIPVIALTADDSRDMHRATIGHGCDVYLTKPIERGRLVQTLNQFV